MLPCNPGTGRQRPEDAWDFLDSLTSLIGEFWDNERLCLKTTRWAVSKKWHCRGRPLASMCTHRATTPLSLYMSPLQYELKRCLSGMRQEVRRQDARGLL